MEQEIFHSSHKKDSFASDKKGFGSGLEKEGFHYPDRSERRDALNNSAGKKGIFVSAFDTSSIKKNNTAILRKCLEEMATPEELEIALEENINESGQIDTNLLIDLSSKLNIGKEIQSETVEMCAELKRADMEGRMHKTSFLGDMINRADIMILQIKEHKLILKSEESILRSLTCLGQLFRKLLSAIEISKAKKLEGNRNGSNGKMNRIQEKKQSFSQELMFLIQNNFDLGEDMESQILNSMYVELLSLMEQIEKVPIKVVFASVHVIMKKICEKIEDSLNCAIWVKKANEIVDSNSTLSMQLSYSKLQEIIKSAPQGSVTVKNKVSEMTNMGNKYSNYVCSYESISDDLEERRISQLSASELKVLQENLTELSKKYSQVPYCLKNELKSKQQQIEKTIESIGWSVAAKGILEKRVNTLDELQTILQEQTQQQLQPSQNRLIQDINLRITAVKNANAILNRIKFSTKLSSSSSNKKLSVDVFTELSDTFKDLNQYINLDHNIEEVELFLQDHHQQEMQILKLYKNWTHRLNDQSLNLSVFRKDIQTIKDIMASSLFEWSKYESNVRGLELMLKVKEALDETNRGSMSLGNAQELQNEIDKFEANDNYVLKFFDGRKEFARQIKEAEQIKAELNICNKSPITLERLDEIITSLQNSCINCSIEKSKVYKMKQNKDKIMMELRIIEGGAKNLNNKVSMKKVIELVDQMKTSCLIIEPGKSILEKKLHLAGQLGRSAKSYGNLDVEKLIQQYNHQTIQIQDIELLIADNKLIEESVIDFQEKLQYCWEDYEDLIEVMQSLMGVKSCFQNKEKVVLLKHKVLALISVCIYNNWRNRRQLTGLTYQTFKLLLSQLQGLDDKFHLAKNTMEKVPLFNFDLFKQMINEKNMHKMQIEEERDSKSDIEKEQINKTDHETSIVVEEDEQKAEQEKKSEGKKSLQSQKEQGEKKSTQSIEIEQQAQISPLKKLKSLSSIDFETEFQQFMKSIQDEVVSESTVVRLGILKACRDEMEKQWEYITARVREIRNISRLPEIDKAENEFIYRIGCVDLMDILIEHKIALQLKEEQAKKTSEQQESIKQKQIQQYLAKTKNFPKPNDTHSNNNNNNNNGIRQTQQQQTQPPSQYQQYNVIGGGKSVGIISAGVASIMNQNLRNTVPGGQPMKITNVQAAAAVARQILSDNAISVDNRIENMMIKGGFRVVDKKSKHIAKRMLMSLLSNPFYMDVDRGLLENTALFMAKRVAQTKTPSEIIEIMLLLVEHIKTDFYSSEQYRRAAFSFNTLVTMTKLRYTALQQLVADKKQTNKNNAEPVNELQKKDKVLVANNPIIVNNAGPQIIPFQPKKEKVIKSNNNGILEKKRINSKKIIDHLEYLSLTEGFSNTDNHDPQVKELRQLMQSKDTLQQFRKLQAELRRMGGEEIPQDIEKKLSVKDKDKEKDKGKDKDQDKEKDKVKFKDSVSVSKKSAGRLSGKKSDGTSSGTIPGDDEGEFSSEDEEEYEQDLIASHPSVLKYIKGVGKGQIAKTLIDPIKEEEMDGFVEFCLGLMRARKSKANKIKYIMFNPNEGEDDDELTQNNIQYMLAGHYDPETVAEGTKKKYVLFSGDCEMKNANLKVLCIVIERESVIVECPELQTEFIKQSGECESREAKEFLLRTYRSQSVLTLFGEIENLEQQNILDSIAQDLHDRDRVGTAAWSTSTKLYFFHKRLFERDHQNGRLFRKFSSTASELCFALVFKPAGLSPEQITAIPRIKQILTLEEYNNSLNNEQDNSLKIQQQQKNPTSKPQFKKPLPRYRKDTVLRTYVPIKEDLDGSQNEFSVLNILLKPDEQREREVKRKWKESDGKISIFKKPSSIKIPIDQVKREEVEAFFLRRLDGKRTVKPSLKKLDDIKLRMRERNAIDFDIPFPREKSSDEEQSMKKRSVHFSDMADIPESGNPECEGINDYSLQLDAIDQAFGNNDHNKIYPDDLSEDNNNNSDLSHNLNSSYDDLESHRKYGIVSPFEGATPSQDPRIAAKFSNRPPALSSVSSISQQSVQSEYSHPLSSNISVSSVSPGSIDKNRQRLLEFAQILENIKPSTFKTSFSISQSNNNNDSSVDKNTDSNPQQMGMDEEIEYSRSVSISPPSSSPSIHPVPFNNPFRINQNQDTQINKYTNNDNMSNNIYNNKENNLLGFNQSQKQLTFGNLSKPSGLDSDGLITPQLSISKDSIESKESYSNGSGPSSDFSSNTLSGKRSQFNTNTQPYSFFNGQFPTKHFKPNNDSSSLSASPILHQQQPTTFFQKFMQNQSRLQQAGILQQNSSLDGNSSSSNLISNNNNSNTSQTNSKTSQDTNYSKSSFSISSDHSSLSPSSSEISEPSNNKTTPIVHNFLNNHFQSESNNNSVTSSSNTNSNLLFQKPTYSMSHRQMKPALGIRGNSLEDGGISSISSSSWSIRNNSNVNFKNNNRMFQQQHSDDKIESSDTNSVDELVEDSCSPVVGIPQQNQQGKYQKLQQQLQSSKFPPQPQRSWEQFKQPFKTISKGVFNDSSSSFSSSSSQLYPQNSYKSTQLRQNFVQERNDKLDSPSPQQNNKIVQNPSQFANYLQQQQMKKLLQSTGYPKGLAEQIQQKQEQRKIQQSAMQIQSQSAKSSAFIYEQDSYQYNSKVFNKSIKKKQNSMVGSDLESEEGLITPSSSSSSKTNNENQLMDLRNQLDSLLSVIQKKKQSVHVKNQQ